MDSLLLKVKSQGNYERIQEKYLFIWLLLDNMRVLLGQLLVFKNRIICILNIGSKEHMFGEELLYSNLSINVLEILLIKAKEDRCLFIMAAKN